MRTYLQSKNLQECVENSCWNLETIQSQDFSRNIPFSPKLIFHHLTELYHLLLDLRGLILILNVCRYTLLTYCE